MSKSTEPSKDAREFILAEDIGAAIATLRGEKTQKDCARRGGLDRPSWNQYEKGHTFPQARTIERIARGLGVEVFELTEAVFRAWSLRMNRDLLLDREEPQVYDFQVSGKVQFRKSDDRR